MPFSFGPLVNRYGHDASMNSNQIRMEQLRILHRQMLFMLITSGFVASAIVFALWDRFPKGILLGWLLPVYVISIIRFVDWRWFWANPGDEKSLRRRTYLLVTFSAISGCIWGSAGVLFVNANDVLAALLISMTLPAMVAGATSSLSVLLPGYVAFSVPALSFIALRLFSLDDRIFVIAGSLTLLFLAANVIFARNLNRSVIESIKLKFENVELMNGYRHQKQVAELARDKSEQANLAKSKFLAAASHDLRQPLHALFLLVDALKDAASDAEREKIFPRIDLSLDALKKLFDALLDVSKLDANVVKPDLSHFDISTFLQEMADEFSFEADKKDIALKVVGNPEIVVSDRLLLQRVVRNLVSNAIRYTEAGRVLLSARKRGEGVLLQVWDTGVGIPEERQEEVFAEFKQLHNTHRDRAQGLGLGLALVRRLCNLLEHPLTLKSKVGRGSVFGIRLPAGSASEVMDHEIGVVSHSWSLDGRCIVVIDDERDVLQAMMSVLSKWGCRVVASSSLSEALEALEGRNLTPELVLSDLRLRDDKTGIEAIDSLRKIFSTSLPGVLITGDIAPERIVSARQSGYAVVHKPVRPAQLRTVIAHCLSGS